MDEARVAFQILIAGNTLAGLTLVFIGNIVTSFSGYRSEEQSSVRGAYRLRIWLAFAGFLTALLAAVSALSHNWTEATWSIELGVGLLLISMLCVFIVALNAARGI